MSHFGEQIAPASVLRMICFNHGLMGDLMGPFTDPLVPSQTKCCTGATRLSGDHAPWALTFFSTTDAYMQVGRLHASI